jgi:hypothetical protein
MISQMNAAIQHYKSNKDPRGLGRWVEQTFKGKGTHFLTVISGYQPNQSKTAQPCTVFWQHCDRFNQLWVDSNEENLTEPRKQILNNL